MSKPVFEDVFKLSGRRNRLSYFLFTLATTVLSLVAFGLIAVGAAADAGILMVPAVVILVPTIVTGLLVGAQRCRDFGWTGWAILIALIPYIGWIFPFVMLFVPGTVGANRYGPDPLQAAEALPAAV